MTIKKVIISTILILCQIGCKNANDSVFSDENYQDSIKQNIGGTLIRDIHYYNDFQSYIFDIKYSFRDRLDSIYAIGSGSYYSQKPPKDEQLIYYGKWTILMTSRDRDADVLFIYDNNLKNWTEYEISPETIEQSDLWKKQNINSQIANWDNVSKINKLDKNGTISVVYTFAKKNRIFSFITGKRQIIYQIDSQSGRLKMTKILEK